jgi:hypothetical protein
MPCTELIVYWLKWARMCDIRTLALVSNCVSAIIFTFSLDRYNVSVDSNRLFNIPTIWVNPLISMLATSCFELLMALSLVMNHVIDTIDEMLFFVLIAWLMMVSMFHACPKQTTVVFRSGVQKVRIMKAFRSC